MTPENETYLKWHKASGLQVGDEVSVIRAGRDSEMGWVSHPANVFNGNLTYIIQADLGAGGFELNNLGRFPYFVLRLVKKAPVVKKVTISSQYTAEVSQGGIKVGCTTFTHEKLDELCATSKEVREQKQDKPSYPEYTGPKCPVEIPAGWRLLNLGGDEIAEKGDKFMYGSTWPFKQWFEVSLYQTLEPGKHIKEWEKDKHNAFLARRIEPYGKQ
jgi:hypothetical protein